MRNWAKRGTAGLAAIVLAAPLAAQAASAADTGWTSARGLYEIRTWTGQAKWGSDNGSAAEATLFHPYSLASLPDGSVLVSERGNHLLRKLTASAVSSFAGLPVGDDDSGLPLGAYHDGAAAEAAFNEPGGIAADAKGNVYVADTGNNAVRKIGADGQATTLAGNGEIGSADGKGKDARFNAPSDVAVDSVGNVYVADTLNNAIRKISADGEVTTLTASSDRAVQYQPGAAESSGDYADGPIAQAKFNEPSALALDGKGNLYVSDRGNQRIRYIDFAAGTVTTVAGSAPAYADDALYAEGGYADGEALSARFDAPEGLALAPDGTLVIADSLNHAIRLLKDGRVTTLAGVATEYGTNDGVTYAAHFNRPTDVAVLPDGRIAIADEDGNKVRVLEKYAKPEGLADDGTVHTILDGKLVKTDVPAYQTNGATLLPLRSVGEALGYDVSYDEKTKSGKLTLGGVVYSIEAGRKGVTQTANGRSAELVLNGAPVVRDKRLFVPVRFFADEASLDIQWDAAASAVVLRHKIFS
ncbi:stalk domain-containing protein [Cohnella zeiphila]|uniref:Copper amine oxidase n=1 Tax=Cohnella zeiphila TaxID=2761120 RepID=A0A7X0SN07_9BACL|nr:stalk domain-containing protein [Cohnella zeiphila]MBB6732987.1 copper amine oxidase [Cohnella zeiphila]